MKNIRPYIALSLALFLISCSFNGATGPQISLGNIYEIALTVDTKGEVHLSGEASIPTPLRSKLVDVNWLAAFDIAFNESEERENSLYLLYEEDGDVIQEIYRINHPFEITFSRDDWVRKIKHNGNGNIVVFVESRGSTVSSQSQSQASSPNSSNSQTSSYWCDDLSGVKLEIGDKVSVNWAKVNLRSYAEVPQDYYANIVAQVEEDTRVTIIGGPECAHEGTWWEVRTEYGDTGWMREFTESNGYLLK